MPCSSARVSWSILLDRVFERADGVVQIGRLRVEEVLALGRRRELFERGHVDGPERRDRVVQARDFALQIRRLHVRRELRGKLGFIDARRLQLLDELLAADARRLLLQLQFVDLVAQRLQRAFGHETLLVGLTQTRGEIVEFDARRVQGFLTRRAHFERVLQTGLRSLLVDGFEFGARVFQRARDALALIVRRLDVAPVLVDLRGQAAHGEARVARGALQFAQFVTRVREFFVERFERELVVFETRLQLRDLAIVTLERGFRFGAQRTLFLDLRGDFFQFLADLRIALRVALVRLRELQHVELQRVDALRRALRGGARVGERLRACVCAASARTALAFASSDKQRLRAHLLREILDFLGAREHARLLGIRRVELHAHARHDMPRLHDERGAFRQLIARGQRLREIVGDESRGEPFVEHGAQARIVDTHERQQRAQALAASRTGLPAAGGE